MNQKGFISNILGILVVLGVIIAIAFGLGMRYEKSQSQSLAKQQEPEAVSQTIFPQKEDLELRCGEIPAEAYPKGSEVWSKIEGPFWSPDCRYASSSLSIVGRGSGPDFSFEDTQKFVQSLPAGVFLYNDASKILTKVYKNGTVEEWKDSQNFTFTSEGKKYNYYVIDKKVSSL